MENKKASKEKVYQGEENKLIKSDTGTKKHDIESEGTEQWRFHYDKNLMRQNVQISAIQLLILFLLGGIVYSCARVFGMLWLRSKILILWPFFVCIKYDMKELAQNCHKYCKCQFHRI